MDDPTQIQSDDTPESVEAQLLAFDLTDPGQEPPIDLGEPEAQEEAPVEPETRFVGWQDVLPDDPNLPPTYRGKRTFGDVWNERTDLVQKTHRYGQLLNEKDAELRTMRATLELLSRGQQQAAPQPAQTQEEVDFGRELVMDPNAAIGRVSQQIRQQVLGEVQGTIQELQSQVEQSRAEKFLDGMSNASYAAASHLQIPKPAWDARMRDMMTTIHQKAGDIRAFQDPRWWAWAHEETAGRWGAAPVAAQPERAMTGTNTRSAGVRPSSGAKPLPARFQKLAAQYAADFGVDAAALEAEMRRDFETGKVR